MRIAVIAVLSSGLQIYFPWWTAVVVAFMVEIVLGKGDSTSFFAGFYGVSIPWMALSTYINIHNDSMLAVQVLELFKLPAYGIVMIVITGLIGGLAGGLGSLSAGWTKLALQKKND